MVVPTLSLSKLRPFQVTFGVTSASINIEIWVQRFVPWRSGSEMAKSMLPPCRYPRGVNLLGVDDDKEEKIIVSISSICADVRDLGSQRASLVVPIADRG